MPIGTVEENIARIVSKIAEIFIILILIAAIISFSYGNLIVSIGLVLSYIILGSLYVKTIIRE